MAQGNTTKQNQHIILFQGNMGKRTLQIVLDNPGKSVYFQSEVVTGRVVLTIEEELKVRGMYSL